MRNPCLRPVDGVGVVRANRLAGIVATSCPALDLESLRENAGAGTNVCSRIENGLHSQSVVFPVAVIDFHDTGIDAVAVRSPLLRCGNRLRCGLKLQAFARRVVVQREWRQPAFTDGMGQHPPGRGCLDLGMGGDAGREVTEDKRR